MISPGNRAPDVLLKTTDGERRVSSYLGRKTIVLYFYPKDETAGCTIEACSFRDAYEDFLAAGAEVIGVSRDSLSSHDSFKEHHRLPFILASDDGSVARAFDVDRGFLGLVPGRVTYVIDKDGFVRDSFSSQIRMRAHVERALGLVRTLESDSEPVTLS
jgi:peroxiredoxin Q/BCP